MKKIFILRTASCGLDSMHNIKNSNYVFVLTWLFCMLMRLAKMVPPAADKKNCDISSQQIYNMYMVIMHGTSGIPS